MKAKPRTERVTRDKLELLCKVNPGSRIEFSEDGKSAFLKLENPRREYRASLDSAVTK